MITENSYTTPTDNFLGVCQPCRRPIRGTAPHGTPATARHIRLACPECAGWVTVERLHAVTTTDVCDPRCMGATGRNCSCACGGANHGGAFNTTVTEELESAVAAYRARMAAADKKRNDRADRERRARKAAFDDWATDHRDVLDYLAGDHGYHSEFLTDLASEADALEILTDRQVDAVRRGLAKRAARQADKAEFDANAKPVPTGNGITIEGVVEKVTFEDSRYAHGRIDFRMCVRCDGFKVWSTVPKVLFQDADGMVRGGAAGRLQGQRVQFVADVELSKNDPAVGNAKRPRRAVRVA